MNCTFFLYILLLIIHLVGITIYFGFGPMNLTFTYDDLKPGNVPQYRTTGTFVDEMRRYYINWFLELLVALDWAVPIVAGLSYMFELFGSDKAANIAFYYMGFDLVFAAVRVAYRFIIFGWCTSLGQICRNPNPLGKTSNWSFNENQTWMTVFIYSMTYPIVIVVWFFLYWVMSKTGRAARAEIARQFTKEHSQKEANAMLDEVLLTGKFKLPKLPKLQYIRESMTKDVGVSSRNKRD